MDWMELAKTIGFPALCVVGMAVGLLKLARWMDHRLFSSEGGLVTVAIKDHKAHVTKLDESTAQAVGALKDIGVEVKGLRSDIGELKVAQEDNTTKLDKLCDSVGRTMGVPSNDD